MLKTAETQLLENRWSDADAAGKSESELLLYRSNILGSDKRVTNYGGGNTSAKVMETDPLTGDQAEVLWVKGSGGDIGSIKMDGFSTLYMDKLRALKGLYRGVDFEDEMVGYLPHCTFNLNPRAASIDTPLHAYVPRTHVDHVHADAIIAIAAILSPVYFDFAVNSGTYYTSNGAHLILCQIVILSFSCILVFNSLYDSQHY